MKVALYFIIVFAGIGAPVGATLLFTVFGPPAYVLAPGLDASRLDGSGHTAEGARIVVRSFDDAAQAREVAKGAVARIDATRTVTSAGITRYVRRDSGGHGMVAIVDRLVLQIDAADPDGVDAVLDRLDFIVENPRRNPIVIPFSEHRTAVFAAIGLYLAAYLLFLTRGAAWAARIAPSPGGAIVDGDELRRRLLAINALDVPFEVLTQASGRLRVQWRIADERWRGLLHAGTLRRVHRIDLQFDEADRRVRAVDTAYAVSTSVSGLGRFRAGASWFRGVSFVDVERGRETGLLLDDDGHWRLRDAYNYRFDVAEMKQPIIAAVTGAGWTYSPVMMFFRPLGG